jgi:hypothetical protein
MPSRFILNEFNLNLASARLLVRFWFLVLVVLVGGTVVGVLVVYKLVGGRGMDRLVGPFGRVVLHGWLLVLRVWGVGGVGGHCGGRWTAKGHAHAGGQRALRCARGRSWMGRLRMSGEGQERGRAVKGRETKEARGGSGGKGQMRMDRWRGLLGALRGSRNRIPFPATTAYLYPELSQAHPQTITYFHSQTS